MILRELLSGLILFSSFAMRTPNDESIKKDDYEVSLWFKSKSIYLKRDWERELGQNYIDDEIWFTWTPSIFYIKPQYINKTSRDLKYTKVDARYKKDWFSIGYTGFYSEEKFEQGTSIGISNKKKFNSHFEMVTKLDGYYFRDDVLGLDRFDKEQSEFELDLPEVWGDI